MTLRVFFIYGVISRLPSHCYRFLGSRTVSQRHGEGNSLTLVVEVRYHRNADALTLHSTDSWVWIKILIQTRIPITCNY